MPKDVALFADPGLCCIWDRRFKNHKDLVVNILHGIGYASDSDRGAQGPVLKVIPGYGTIFVFWRLAKGVGEAISSWFSLTECLGLVLEVGGWFFKKQQVYPPPIIPILLFFF